MNEYYRDNDRSSIIYKEATLMEADREDRRAVAMLLWVIMDSGSLWEA